MRQVFFLLCLLGLIRFFCVGQSGCMGIAHMPRDCPAWVAELDLTRVIGWGGVIWDSGVEWDGFFLLM